MVNFGCLVLIGSWDRLEQQGVGDTDVVVLKSLKIFKTMKSRDLQPRLLYPAKLSFRIERQIKSFPDRKKTKGVHHEQPIII